MRHKRESEHTNLRHGAYRVPTWFETRDEKVRAAALTTSETSEVSAARAASEWTSDRVRKAESCPSTRGAEREPYSRRFRRCGARQLGHAFSVFVGQQRAAALEAKRRKRQQEGRAAEAEREAAVACLPRCARCLCCCCGWCAAPLVLAVMNSYLAVRARPHAIVATSRYTHCVSWR